MNHYILTHIEHCDSKYCQKKDVVLCINDNFYLITYYLCNQPLYVEYYEYIKLLLEKLYDVEEVDKYSIEKGYVLASDISYTRNDKHQLILSQDILRDMASREYAMNINYIYKDGSGKHYYIGTKIPIETKINNSDAIVENAKMFTKYLLSNGYEYLIKDVDELTRLNYIHIPESVIITSIDKLINKLNKYKS